jgi:hypothetical protein
MHALELMAERRIAEAVSRGELDGLPGAGRPLDLEDDALVPEEERMANRILKNAGFGGGEARAETSRKLRLMRLEIESKYFRKVLGKLGR